MTHVIYLYICKHSNFIFMYNMSQMKCISDVVTEYAFQITRPSVIDDVAEILEEAEVERRHHTSDEDNSAHVHGGSSADDQ